ncbi:Probable ABC transporter permease protein HI_1471 [Candidatus Ornithobacterium hominis]|uniref:Probable ABC transporter permease protein HI_1471 n=1 Tax=Candidatus Ornithobacterium hominis TaxID=2497989 RepID=A0A383TX43_9FLAO|nr:iron ABC transporter permease [Candidatus Ornithobacterium hominis]MCT7904564.1 iron ABC transporter permease [Candidatus Ornithobacterium hominis]SZD71461.1 Probable ABC transporter permease protein HI_1471 [Candidatus Ornithobacterium hominis]
MHWKWYSDKVFWFWLLALLSIFLLNLVVGKGTANIFKGLENSDKELMRDLIINYRLPKGLAAVLTGISLSASGWVLQEYFRNPLAGPSVLGVTSFSGLGVAIVIVFFGLFSQIDINQPALLIFSALSGAAFAMLVIILFSYKIKSVSALVLIGFMLSGLAGAIISLLQFYANTHHLKSLIIWSFGSISGLSYTQIIYFLTCVVVGLMLIFLSLDKFQKLQLGHDYAHTMGVNIHYVKFIVILSSSLLTGVATALVGPIVFIGIAIPHLVRINLKSANFKKVFTYIIIIGAFTLSLFSLISDNIPGQVLPINIISALLGAPVLIWIIYQNKNKML